MFDLSYTEALRIQRAQMVYYRQLIGRKGMQYIKSITQPCPSDIHPDTPISIFTINKLVPRGGNFEGRIRWFTKYKKELDTTSSAWHDAIRRGLQW